MKFREMMPEDLDLVAAIENICFSDPWSKDGFISSLEEPASILLVAENEEGKIAGYCCLYGVLDEGEIVNVAVSPEFRKKGYGAGMVTDLMRRGEERGIRTFFLEVRAGNDSARRLYSELGFKELSIRKGFYEYPKEDGILMCRQAEN